MALAERLSVKVYCTSSASKVQWRHLTHLESGYAALIDYVLDRYARRFGAVWPERASELQRRLADKYCPQAVASLNLNIEMVKGDQQTTLSNT